MFDSQSTVSPNWRVEDYMRCIREISMTSDFEVKTAKTVLVPSDSEGFMGATPNSWMVYDGY